jgi:hypothetical protein
MESRTESTWHLQPAAPSGTESTWHLRRGAPSARHRLVVQEWAERGGDWDRPSRRVQLSCRNASRRPADRNVVLEPDHVVTWVASSSVSASARLARTAATAAISRHRIGAIFPGSHLPGGIVVPPLRTRPHRNAAQVSVERVLVSHGEPVHTRADHERALERGPWSGSASALARRKIAIEVPKTRSHSAVVKPRLYWARA